MCHDHSKCPLRKGSQEEDGDVGKDGKEGQVQAANLISYRGAVVHGVKGAVHSDRGESSGRSSTKHGGGSHNSYRYNNKGKGKPDRALDFKKRKAHGEHNFNEGLGTTLGTVERLVVPTVVGTGSLETDIGLNFSDHEMKILEAFLGDNPSHEKGVMGSDLNVEQGEIVAREQEEDWEAGIGN